jgi:hypothetical protein
MLRAACFYILTSLEANNCLLQPEIVVVFSFHFEYPRAVIGTMEVITELSHLSNSAELASLADIRVKLEEAVVPLHSAVLATQSRVLCMACCTAQGDKDSIQRVVQQELEQYAQSGVLLFLSLVYNPAYLISARPVSSQDVEVAVRLSHKLDAPVLLTVSDRAVKGRFGLTLSSSRN